jgi:hypothetical protein
LGTIPENTESGRRGETPENDIVERREVVARECGRHHTDIVERNRDSGGKQSKDLVYLKYVFLYIGLHRNKLIKR